MTPAISKAIEEIRASFPDCVVEAEPNDSAGVNVVVRGVQLGMPYLQLDTWIGFLVTFQYPYADVYPHFTRPDLTRADGQGLRPGLGGGAQFRGQPAVQISRRSNRWNPATDTAAIKLLKVHQWLLTNT
jgi:hypothetical protein